VSLRYYLADLGRCGRLAQALGWLMRIRVLKPSFPGDEPDFVREAWVGLELPVLEGKEQPVLVPPAKLPWRALSFSKLVARLFSRQLPDQPMPAYLVSAAEGFEVLERERPEAAKWWKRRFPDALSGRYNFRFNAENCQELRHEPA